MKILDFENDKMICALGREAGTGWDHKFKPQL